MSGLDSKIQKKTHKTQTFVLMVRVRKLLARYDVSAANSYTRTHK